MKNKQYKITQNQAFWPVIIFLTIILFNTIMTRGEFLSISIVDGHFYGRIIDIFRNGGKLMILAAGMTMVLATGGTDISVGSVMAISGAIACSIIRGVCVAVSPPSTAIWTAGCNRRRRLCIVAIRHGVTTS